MTMLQQMMNNVALKKSFERNENVFYFLDVIGEVTL